MKDTQKMNVHVMFSISFQEIIFGFKGLIVILKYCQIPRLAVKFVS